MNVRCRTVVEKEGKEQVPAIFLGGFLDILSNHYCLILIGKNSATWPHLGLRGDWEIYLFWAIMCLGKNQRSNSREGAKRGGSTLTTSSLYYNCPFYFSASDLLRSFSYITMIFPFLLFSFYLNIASISI